MRNLIMMAAAVAFVAVGCGEKKQQTQSLDSAKFTYVKGDVLVGGQPASLGQAVSKDATIEVKKNSMAVLQFSNAASITLKANTTLSIANMNKGSNGAPVIELSQSSGSSFSKIAKGQSEFSIKTPTAVAGVRGTSFELTVGNGKVTQIKLLEGKVAVAKADATTEVNEATFENATIVEAGQKVDATAAKVSAPVEISDAEKSSLQAMNTVEIAPVSGAVVVPDSVAAYATGEAATASLATAAPATEKAEVKKLTLADIKAKYGRIAKIQTKNGKEYVGYFNQQGGEMTIQTVDGQVRVPVASVQKITQL